MKPKSDNKQIIKKSMIRFNSERELSEPTPQQVKKNKLFYIID